MWHLNYIIDQIKMADNKMNILLAIYLFLSGISVSNIKRIVFTFNNLSLYCKVFFIIDLVIFVIFLTCFYIAFLKTIIPRINAEKILNIISYKSIIFWGDLTKMDISEFENVETKKFYHDLNKQIIINSRIAEKKFNNVRKAYIYLLPTIICFVVLMLFLELVG
ncbi:hypothetical protein JCM30566_19470 [Marinitoga arctica]